MISGSRCRLRHTQLAYLPSANDGFDDSGFRDEHKGVKV